MPGSARFAAKFLFAQALISGASVIDAARQAGIHERTAYRWLAKPEFRRRLAQMQHAQAQRAVSHMTDGMTEAADTLRELLKVEDHDVRVRAARALLDLGPRLRDSVELESRLVDLEQQQTAAEGATP